MDREKEAKRILEAIEAGNFTFRDHARRRSDERLLSRESVAGIAASLIAWTYQEDKFTHRFIGFLGEDEGGGFTAVFDEEGEVRVVTVFKRRLSRGEKRRSI